MSDNCFWEKMGTQRVGEKKEISVVQGEKKSREEHNNIDWKEHKSRRTQVHELELQKHLISLSL